MAQPQKVENAIPVLTEVIAGVGERPALPADRDTLVAELQTELASRTFLLAEELLRSAFAEMGASLFEQVSAKLRRELPELIDATLREHLDTDHRS
jgi:hypothetical protein